MSDTRIPLSGGLGNEPERGGVVGGALGTLGQMMRIKEQVDVYKQRQQQRLEEQRELEDDEAIRTTLPKYARPDEAIDDLYKQGRAKAAAKLGTSIYNERKAKAAAYDAQLVSAGKRLTQAGQIAQGITDDSTYQPARKALVELLAPLYGDTISDVLPTMYDAGKMKAIIASGTARAQQITAEHNAAQEAVAAAEKGLIANPYQPGGPLAQPDMEAGAKWSKAALEIQDHHKKGLSMVLPYAKTKDQWDGYIAQFRAQGMSPETEAQLPAWDDADPAGAKKAAADMALTTKEKVDISRQADRDRVLKDQGARRIDIAAARATAAAAGGGGGGTGRGGRLTVNAMADMKETRNKAMRVLDQKHRADTLTDDEYLDQKIELQNDYRDAAEGLLPFDAAAAKAVADGDKAGYDALAEKYKAITGGKRTLNGLVPWKGPSAGSGPAGGRGGGSGAPPTTPAGLQQKAIALRTERFTATPERQVEIDKELKTLMRR
jgi:hypothetical protein